MRLRKRDLVSCLILYFVLLSAHAQHTDKSFTTTSDECSAVHWSDAILEKYPTVVPACQSVEIHDGVTYVKFSAVVVRSRDRGRDLTLALKDGGEVTVRMPEKTKLSIDGRATSLASLQHGDKLNFYVPQGRVVAQFYPENEAPAAAAPVVSARFESPAPQTGERMDERVAAALPATASDLPLIGLWGFLLVSVGAGLTAARVRRR